MLMNWCIRYTLIVTWMIWCTRHVANWMVIKCIPSVNMPLIKKCMSWHISILYFEALCNVFMKWLRYKMYDIMVHIYILYDIFIRVSKNERHRLGWMKSWNWNLVATSIIRKIHQELGRILWYASMLRNENTRSYEIEVEHW
jgi:hypothetical protein